MSKSSDRVVNGDGDETMLFDDGYSIVDDINTGTGIMEENTGMKSHDKENDKEVKKEDATKKKEETKEDVEKEKDRNTLKKENDTIIGEKVVVKKEKLEEPKISYTKNTDVSDATLIISNDDDLGSEVLPMNDCLAKTGKRKNELNKEKSDTMVAKNTNGAINHSVTKSTRKKKTTEGSFVWISNISKLVKASSLKKHFAECGKVNTAKVVTNGKVFFGYVEFEYPEHALNCVKTLNNSILGGKKIIVSRNRPDVNRKTAPTKKNLVNNETISKVEEMKRQVVGIEQPEQLESESKRSDDDKKKIEGSTKDEKPKRTKNDEIVNNNKSDAEEKKQADEKQKNDNKNPRSVKNDLIYSKNEDLKYKLHESKRKIEVLKQDLTRSQIEISNLRRRLRNEQKKSKAEEIRNQKYRIEVRSLSDQLKQTRSDFDKEMHRVVKKHKVEMEKADYYRANFLKQKDELKRRQEELDREFRKLEQSKQSLDHMKRSRKSRSLSPPIKRFRGREGPFHDHRSPPPPPKLSSEVRPKTPLERSSVYYEEKKPRAIYDRLGDYADKSFPKDSSVRERGSYPTDVAGMQKSSWSHSSAESWKKPNNPSTFVKPYMERFGTHQGFQVPQSSYYSQGALDYNKHNHFDIARKY